MTPDDMPRDASGGSRPVPDPTKLTTDAVEQAVTRAREYVDGQIAILGERLSGQLAVLDEKFESIELQFQERDRALSAAFDAQKELSAQASEAHQRAADKAEQTTAETISQIGTQLADLKDRVGRFESLVTARAEARSAQEAQQAALMQTVRELQERMGKVA